MPQQKSYSIGELAEEAQVTTRTIRYYVAEELLPPPEGGGRAASYSDEHLARLALIKILKDEYLPLQEIQSLLSGLDHQAVVELLEEKRRSEAPPAPTLNSAKAYLRTLLKPAASPAQAPGLMRHKVEAQKRRETGDSLELSTGVARAEINEAPAPALAQRAQPSAPGEAAQALFDLAIRELEAGEIGELASKVAPTRDAAPLPPDQAQTGPVLTRWQRIEITPDIELHIKEGLEPTQIWSKIEQLIKIARQILK